MSTKKKVTYPEGVRNWKIKSQQWVGGRLNFLIECPFCFMRTLVNVKASEKTGKKCKKCKGIHYMTGHTSRGYVPRPSDSKQEISLEESRTRLNLPMYKEGTLLNDILHDGWSRGFDSTQTQKEAKVMGYDISIEQVEEVWKELGKDISEDNRTEKKS